MDAAMYEEVVKLAKQLSPVEQQALIAHLQSLSKRRKLTNEEWKALLRASILSVPVKEDFSNRREDWYDDDGR
jgi:hypothetical protein